MRIFALATEPPRNSRKSVSKSRRDGASGTKRTLRSETKKSKKRIKINMHKPFRNSGFDENKANAEERWKFDRSLTPLVIYFRRSKKTVKRRLRSGWPLRLRRSWISSKFSREFRNKVSRVAPSVHLDCGILFRKVFFQRRIGKSRVCSESSSEI